MGKLFQSVNNFFKANTWSGAAWLLTLCLMLILLAVGYIIAHNDAGVRGTEYVQLNKKQMLTIKKFLDNNPDSSSDTDQRNRIRKERTKLILLFLEGEFDNKLTSRQKSELESLLNQVNNADAYDYLSEKKLSKQSFFWLTGSNIYIEAWLWCLMGVLASLIYYVSIANTKTLTTAGNDDSGNFDPGEIPGQVAKMFYAPAVTIVIILGYHYLSDGSGNMVDISMSTGLIVFSFIAGFFSARLMKFLDRLKELILPFSSTNSSAPAQNKSAKSDVTVQVQLAPALAGSADADSIKTKLNEAVITITPENGGDAIPLANASENKPDVFVGSQVPQGKYILNGAMAYKKDATTKINLSGKQAIEVNGSNTSFTLQLDKVEEGE